jgi:polysaccharide biosynthesis protein PslG
VLAIHPYARTEAGVGGALGRLHDLLESRGDGERAVWVTEVGWATGSAGGFVWKTEAEQATLLRRTFRLVRDRKSRYELGTVTWFSWRDVSREGDLWSQHTGLFRLDGNPKPSLGGSSSSRAAARAAAP